ncbi:major facilitator superfamily domain-containing protein [Microdochium trichocladiopsis]|uniref:Major facilitator superfamily domain-containing protein n=1 Tax=Microdochium trichocladiopsis TaxID=1682393 RepID=A0A9P9BT42_9PEZI|nr:major facilitator superfamily domain-containing protein [Microdochium trichocladiopsis]KAH7035550.1 major facilitator superfamily domain-containing protein [Microdochium trichocladiopsis]
MATNGASRPEKDPNAFPYKQLTILAICRFSEPIAFNSILAYTYVLVRDLRGTDEDASFYAGLLVSAYAVAEAITAMGWGALSDRYGRKPIVLIGLGGVALSSLIFGLAKSYWVALLARFIGGALNGNVSVMQTMVAEMVKLPEHEPKAYATQPFVWVLGGIIGSAMGGFLAQPAHFYPDIFPEDGLFGQYPYLLPNLVAMIAVILAIIQGIFFLEETNPRASRQASGAGMKDTRRGYDDEHAISDEDEREDEVGAIETTALLDERTPLHGRAKRHSSKTRTSHSRGGGRRLSEGRITGPVFMEESLPLPIEHTFDIRRSSMSTLASFKQRSSSLQPPNGLVRHPMGTNGAGRTDGQDDEDDTAPYTGRVFGFKILMLILAMVLVSYHQMAFSALFPIHLLDEPAVPSHTGRIDFRGGLGYTVHDVGSYLASNGVMGLFIQAVIFPVFVAKVGVRRSFVVMVILYPTAYMLMPFISAMPTVELASLGLTLSLLMQSFYGIISMPCALILLKDATPHSTVLGRVNGLAMSGCCLARTIGPPLAGIIFSAGGSAAAWFSCAGVALLGVVQLLFIPNTVGPEEDVIHGGSGDVERGAVGGGERLHVEA